MKYNSEYIEWECGILNQFLENLPPLNSVPFGEYIPHNTLIVLLKRIKVHGVMVCENHPVVEHKMKRKTAMCRHWTIYETRQSRNTSRYSVFWMENCFGGHFIKIGLYKLILYLFFFFLLDMFPSYWNFHLRLKLWAPSAQNKKNNTS